MNLFNPTVPEYHTATQRNGTHLLTQLHKVISFSSLIQDTMSNQVVGSGSEAAMGLLENAGVCRASAVEHNNQTYRYIDDDQPNLFHLLKRLLQFIIIAMTMVPVVNLVSTALGFVSEEMNGGRDLDDFLFASPLWLHFCILPLPIKESGL